MGTNWNGRMCCAVMRVARSVGGTGDSMVKVSELQFSYYWANG